MLELHVSCYICEKKFLETEKKVVDHDHLTGEVRGIAHNYCNLKFHLENIKIPIFFHNFKGYDSHYIIILLKN